MYVQIYAINFGEKQTTLALFSLSSLAVAKHFLKSVARPQRLVSIKGREAERCTGILQPLAARTSTQSGGFAQVSSPET